MDLDIVEKAFELFLGLDTVIRNERSHAIQNDSTGLRRLGNICRHHTARIARGRDRFCTFQLANVVYAHPGERPHAENHESETDKKSSGNLEKNKNDDGMKPAEENRKKKNFLKVFNLLIVSLYYSLDFLYQLFLV